MLATLKHWRPLSLSVLAAVMPLSFSIDQKIKILPAALLFFAGLWLILSSSHTRRSYAACWPAVCAGLLLIGFVAINVILHRLGWRPLDRPAHILLYMVIAAVFTRPLRMQWVWIGFSLSAIALGAASLIQYYFLDIPRAYGLNGGASASIELATILLGLSLMALARLLSSRIHTAEKALHIAAMIFGMSGALLTQSRGPLLSFAPMFILLVLMYARRTGRWRLSMLFVAAAVVCATVATLAMHDKMVARFEAIGPEVITFDQHGAGQGAVRERLGMWRAAGRAMVAHPLAGVGIDQFNDYVQGEIVAGRSNPIIGKYNQPHNEYLEAGATGGIPGLLVLLLLFVLPLRFFMRHSRDADEGIALPARIGIALSGLYMLCALTDSVFYRVMTHSFYFFLILGMALLIGHQVAERNASAHRVPQ